MRIKYISYILLLAIFSAMMTSCGMYKNIKEVPYFQNSDTVSLDSSAVAHEMVVQPKDALYIFVFALDAEAISFLNMREPHGLKAGEVNTRGSEGFRQFLVDNNGDIEYPVLGKVHVAGKTVHQIADDIREKLSPLYNKDGTLTVNVHLANFYVSVLGEVNKPNTFEVGSPYINVLEALARAGDLTIYGQRTNVKLLRENESGEYEIHQLDLTDANLLNSPYYYLQQRDILYVEPNGVMAQNAKIGRTTQLWVRGASITISLGSLLYRVLK